METLFIDRKETVLSCNQQRLYIAKNKQDSKAVSVPLSHLRAIVISCNCQLSSGMLRQLAKHDISLICLNNRDPEASFISVKQGHGNVKRRINQYHLLHHQALRLRVAKLIIKRKIREQRRLLQEMQNKRVDLKPKLALTCRQLLKSQKQLNQHPLTLNEIMGIEGYASRLYFTVYKQMFNKTLQFNQRKKRPATDPVNAVLSLSYTILYYEAQRACYGQGLDSSLPILHEPCYNRASLACDFQELLRSEVDKWVWSLFQKRVLRAEHFMQQGEACMLSKTGRKNYYLHLPEALTHWRVVLRKHSGLLAKLLDSLTY